MIEPANFINFFRQAAPYLHAHRNKTFVFCIQDNDESSANILRETLHDLAILHSLRIRVVIVFGARYSINKTLKNQKYQNNKRITDSESIKKIQEIVGALRCKIESIFSMGLSNSSMQGSSISVSSGNWVIAKPLGIIDGVDYGFTGEVRKIRTNAIIDKLAQGEIVLISPIGYSATGEVFNLTTEDLACKVAIALKADKLLFLNQNIENLIPNLNSTRAITSQQARSIKTDASTKYTIENAIIASENDVGRVHIIQQNIDGSSIIELFTRDGCGVMVTNEQYDIITDACIDDISSLLALLRPLEKKGVLVRRSRELLEIEIKYFAILKRDNVVIGCAALYPYDNEETAELRCLAISEEYQRGGRADALLQYIEEKARQQNIKKLFCLTTHTSHWFIERGFSPMDVNDLPKEKLENYNHQRASRPFIKIL